MKIEIQGVIYIMIVNLLIELYEHINFVRGKYLLCYEITLDAQHVRRRKFCIYV